MSDVPGGGEVTEPKKLTIDGLEELLKMNQPFTLLPDGRVLLLTPTDKQIEDLKATIAMDLKEIERLRGVLDNAIRARDEFRVSVVNAREFIDEAGLARGLGGNYTIREVLQDLVAQAKQTMCSSCRNAK